MTLKQFKLKKKKKSQYVWTETHKDGKHTQKKKTKNTVKRFILRLSESSESLSFRTRGAFCSQTVFNLKRTMDKKQNCLTEGSVYCGGCVFIIYLKIEQAHSSFYKGDQPNGFCQRPSFQVALKPVNKLNTQRQSHAQVINKAHCSHTHTKQTHNATRINSFVRAVSHVWAAVFTFILCIIRCHQIERTNYIW